MKVKNDFLKRVMKMGSIDTQKFRYRKRSWTTPEYQYAIIERIPLELLPNKNEKWQLVARTWDGKNFLRA